MNCVLHFGRFSESFLVHFKLHSLLLNWMSQISVESHAPHNCCQFPQVPPSPDRAQPRSSREFNPWLPNVQSSRCQCASLRCIIWTFASRQPLGNRQIKQNSFILDFKGGKGGGYRHIQISRREASPYQNGWIFGKVPNGLCRGRKTPSACRHCQLESFCASGKFLRVSTQLALKSRQKIA